MDLNSVDAVTIATAVRARQVSAVEVVTATLNRIDANRELNCFTTITNQTALADAIKIDAAIASGKDPGVLAGVPFAVKNLFDIAGITTLAGAKIDAANPPATQDATAVARLKQAGAILVGALNMDEYAYGFVTENSHYGATHNPHEKNRIAGGSSGGAAAAVAGGMVPLTLGSDTNGSIRVPAALCGVYGFKPTYGRLSRAGAFLFASSFDHIGTFTRSVRDTTTAFDVLQGWDSRDPVCTHREALRVTSLQNDGNGASAHNIDGLRIAIADDYFRTGAAPEALADVERVAQALGATQYITIPEAHRAKAAAFVITASEGANLHLANLRSRLADFDPATRDRFLAGAMIPASWYLQAQRFRSWFRDRVREIFRHVDVIIAPTTPCFAPLIGQQTIQLDGKEVLVRAHLGVFTQPLSFIGLPVLSVPIVSPNVLPLGVQLIAAPYCEEKIFQVAAFLEDKGVVAASVVN